MLLRKPELSDAIAVLAIEGDPATNRYRPSGPMQGLNEASKTIKAWLKDWETYGFGYWVATLRDDLEVVGIGGITHMEWHERTVLNLYYRFSPKAWGHGYATELAKTAVELARTHFPEIPVVARIRSVNEPSIRVVERIGLVRHPNLDTISHMVFTLGW